MHLSNTLTHSRQRWQSELNCGQCRRILVKKLETEKFRISTIGSHRRCECASAVMTQFPILTV